MFSYATQQDKLFKNCIYSQIICKQEEGWNLPLPNMLFK